MAFHAHPAIAAIDRALEELDPRLQKFGSAHEFIWSRSHDGSLNVPRRWLRRELDGLRHDIGLVIALPMPRRLEMGFFSDLPCSIYVAAYDPRSGSAYHAEIGQPEPFRLFGDALLRLLHEALVRLDPRADTYIARPGG